MPTIPDPIKAGLTGLSSGGASVAAGLPVWLVATVSVLSSAPWWIRTWSDAFAHVADTWKPRDDGLPRVMLPRQVFVTDAPQQLPKPVAVEGEPKVA